MNDCSWPITIMGLILIAGVAYLGHVAREVDRGKKRPSH